MGSGSTDRDKTSLSVWSMLTLDLFWTSKIGIIMPWSIRWDRSWAGIPTRYPWLAGFSLFLDLRFGLNIGMDWLVRQVLGLLVGPEPISGPETAYFCLGYRHNPPLLAQDSTIMLDLGCFQWDIGRNRLFPGTGLGPRWSHTNLRSWWSCPHQP